MHGETCRQHEAHVLLAGWSNHPGKQLTSQPRSSAPYLKGLDPWRPGAWAQSTFIGTRLHVVHFKCETVQLVFLLLVCASNITYLWRGDEVPFSPPQHESPQYSMLSRGSVLKYVHHASSRAPQGTQAVLRLAMPRSTVT